MEPTIAQSSSDHITPPQKGKEHEIAHAAHGHDHAHGHSHHKKPTIAQSSGDHITPPQKEKEHDAAHAAHGHDHKPPTFTDTLNSHPVMLPLQAFMLILMIPMAPWMVYMIYKMLHDGFKHEAPMPTVTTQRQAMLGSG